MTVLMTVLLIVLMCRCVDDFVLMTLCCVLMLMCSVLMVSWCVDVLMIVSVTLY
jgi:uncharacterized membrane protein